jgi:hypothetical protein
MDTKCNNFTELTQVMFYPITACTHHETGDTKTGPTLPLYSPPCVFMVRVPAVHNHIYNLSLHRWSNIQTRRSKLFHRNRLCSNCTQLKPRLRSSLPKDYHIPYRRSLD